ncbi:hypothetical protein [Massilia glaciei]|uniref:ABC-type transport auxiliary lipoprotein component domain-containing protein n=1 Tax=Massilia glaciei TaxID=1524097 RepID=A0A2U2HNX0_9BURK|nr:hypothetical protein [Massilia glaciei]PWF49105.1 hypothetical protein C7C56_008220 [Massilia glaciei]
MKPSIYFCAPLLCCLLTAHAAPVEKTPLSYDAQATEIVRITPLQGACAINFMSISDRRFTKDGIGADMPIPSGPPEPWISASLDTLKAYGFPVTHSASPVPGAVNLDVRLTRAYTWITHMRINGMVAIEAESKQADGVKTEKFRSAGSKTNMWGAKSEYVTALNYAVNSVVDQMAPALLRHCQSAKTAAR